MLSCSCSCFLGEEVQLLVFSLVKLVLETHGKRTVALLFLISRFFGA